jgi:hypothetical protein
VETPIIAAPTAHARQGAQANADRVVVFSTTGITHRGPIHSEDWARSPAVHLKLASRVSTGFPLCVGRHHFFEAISLSMCCRASLPPAASACCSSSRTFSRLASDTSSPPYLVALRCKKWRCCGCRACGKCRRSWSRPRVRAKFR